MATHTDAFYSSFFDEQTEVMADHFTVEAGVLFDVFQADFAIPFDEGHHLAAELLGGETAVLGFGALLCDLFLSVRVSELILEDALLLLLFRCGFGRRRSKSVAQVSQGNLGKLWPQTPGGEKADEITQSHGLGALEAFERFQCTQSLELVAGQLLSAEDFTSVLSSHIRMRAEALREGAMPPEMEAFPGNQIERPAPQSAVLRPFPSQHAT